MSTIYVDFAKFETSMVNNVTNLCQLSAVDNNDGTITIKTNGIPNHATGTFPDATTNPNSIQVYVVRFVNTSVVASGVETLTQTLSYYPNPNPHPNPNLTLT